MPHPKFINPRITNDPNVANFDQDPEGDAPQYPPRPKNNFHFKVSLCGKRKKIRKGKYKGYEGIIRNVHGDHAKFELSAICKVISIPLKNLGIDPNQGEDADAGFGKPRDFARPDEDAQNMQTPAFDPNQEKAADEFDGWES